MNERKAAASWANDATDLSPTPPASRGAQLLALTITFAVKLPAESWRVVGPAVGNPDWDPTRRSLLFYALPVQVAALVPYVSGDVHMHPGDKPEAHWVLYWDRALSNEPPESIRQRAKVPFPEIMDRLAESWPSQEPINAAVTGSYLLLANHWRFPSAAPLKLGKGLPVLRPSGWTLDSPSEA
ncbi:MAG TPA: hypothetical protein VFB81_02890, partial [Myxococcales bacterium]|nr:hypothetical protein [Myxococcales bacterium]